MSASQKSENECDAGASDPGKADESSMPDPEGGGVTQAQAMESGTPESKRSDAQKGKSKRGEDASRGETKGSADEPDAPEPNVPESIDLNCFQKQSLVELYQLGTELGLRVGGSRSKHQLVFDLLQFYSRRGSEITAEGVLEAGRDGAGYLRWPAYNFAPTPDSVFVPRNLVGSHGIRQGNLVKVSLKKARDRDKHLCADELLAVEGADIASWEPRKPFDKLTALSPRERLILEHPDKKSVGSRIVDLIAPLGKGQRGLICAPPRGGKTILLKDIATSVRLNHPEVELIVLLLDERPEEVTDFKETVDASVFSSTFDESPKRHVQVSEIVAERAKRLVEIGRDVVILLDSLTRLARGYNSMSGNKGGIGSGGLQKQALEKPRRLFGAARNCEEGGSLTILATALIETESRMDEVIFEEFKGTGNMEIQLDREMVEKRVFPAIHILKSGTRKDDLLYHPQEFQRISTLRRQLAQIPAGEAMEVLIRNIHRTSSNAELLLTGIK